MHKRGVNATVSYKIFVINMAGSAERWNLVKFQLDALNLAYERIEGVDASVLDNSEIASYYSRAENRKQFYRPLGIGEIGCYMAHVRCWEQIVSQQLDFGVVLEDDVILSEHIPDALKILSSNLRQFDFISIQNETKKRRLYSSESFGKFSFYEFVKTSGGFLGGVRFESKYRKNAS